MISSMEFILLYVGHRLQVKYEPGGKRKDNETLSGSDPVTLIAEMLACSNKLPQYSLGGKQT